MDEIELRIRKAEKLIQDAKKEFEMDCMRDVVARRIMRCFTLQRLCFSVLERIPKRTGERYI